jgi:hypothetical protein
MGHNGPQSATTVQVDKRGHDHIVLPEVGNSLKRKERESSAEDSDDPGLCFDDIISPGGELLNFGTFQNLEIRSLWTFPLNNHKSAVINEYGTNISTSKSDRSFGCN